jgi:hypothetical protein
MSFVSDSSYRLALYGFTAVIWQEALFREYGGRKFLLRSDAITLMKSIISGCVSALFDSHSAEQLPLYYQSDIRIWKTLARVDLEPNLKVAILFEIAERQIELLQALPEWLPSNQLLEATTPVREQLFIGFESLLRECRFKIVERSIHLGDEDRDFLQLKEHEPSPDLDRIDCGGYAMLKARVPQAICWIKSGQAPHEFYHGNCVALLRRWGLSPIAQPVRGCLVLYFNNALMPNHLELMHVALHLEDELVLSKLGTNGAVYEHRIFDAPAHYGEFILFFQAGK